MKNVILAVVLGALMVGAYAVGHHVGYYSISVEANQD